jgi:hypothetical protein
MGEEKGVLLAVQEKDLSIVVDSALKLKGIPELLDGYVARILITVVDDQVVDKLKADVKEKLSVVVTKAMAKDWDGALESLSDMLNSLVDVPVLDETAEGLMFLGALQFLAGAIKQWIEKKKAE